MDAGIYFSDWFGVDPSIIEEYGAFDVSLINDLPLFIDPFLLFNSTDSEYQALHQSIIRYMRFLKDVSINETIPEALLLEWFTFKEVKQTWLGFSKVGNEGHGLGRDFAHSLKRNLGSAFRDFGEEKVTKGSHLEKLCLLKDGVGRDNISDFTTNLIKSYLAKYTEAFAVEYLSDSQRQEVALEKGSFNYETRSWQVGKFVLPYINGDFVLLTPKDMLTKDEAWINRSELLNNFPDIAYALPDAALRAQVEQYLRRAIPANEELSDKQYKEIMAAAAERFPQVLDYYIRNKEELGDRAESIADRNVRLIEALFVNNVRPFVLHHLIAGGFYEIGETTRDEALKRARFLKDVIENKGGHKIFYVKGEPIQRESDLHILYRLVWFASPSSVTREANDGRGPVDYKISRGSHDTTLVEFKLAKNTQLKRNLEKQCAIYEAASDATEPSIKVIVHFNENELGKVLRILRDLQLENDPNIIVIDASADNKPSGSKA